MDMDEEEVDRKWRVWRKIWESWSEMGDEGCELLKLTCS